MLSVALDLLLLAQKDILVVVAAITSPSLIDSSMFLLQSTLLIYV